MATLPFTETSLATTPETLCPEWAVFELTLWFSVITIAVPAGTVVCAAAAPAKLSTSIVASVATIPCLLRVVIFVSPF